LRTGSRLSTAFRTASLAAGPSFTAVATELDELVAPAPSAARLDGASNVVIQRLCPARPVDHYLLVGDAVAYKVALDALTHPGPADPARIPATRCLETILPGADLVATAPTAPLAVTGAIARVATAPDLSAEPPLRCPFDAAGCPGPRLRLTRRRRCRGRCRAAEPALRPRRQERASTAPATIATPLAIMSGVPGPAELEISAFATSFSISLPPLDSISTTFER
jgi:hypothetical protein